MRSDSRFPFALICLALSWPVTVRRYFLQDANKFSRQLRITVRLPSESVSTLRWNHCPPWLESRTPYMVPTSIRCPELHDPLRR